MSSFKLCKCGLLASWKSYFGGYYCPNCGLILDDGQPDGGRGGHMTNADKIRGMSDEELVDWAINKVPQIASRYSDSKLGLLDWLQQPAKDGT